MSHLSALLEKAGLGDVNAVTEFGQRTALHLAAWSGDHELCHAVLGCEEFTGVCALDSVGRTALHLAISSRHLSFQEIRSIVEQGPAALSAADQFKRVPLHYAAKRGDAAVCSLLLEWGGVVHAADKGGWTPLHHAADAGHVAVCEVLAIAGGRALVQLGDQDGITAMDLAMEKGHTAVCSALKWCQQQEPNLHKTIKGKGGRCQNSGGGKETDKAPGKNPTTAPTSDMISISKGDCGFDEVYMPRYQIVDIGGGNEDDCNEVEWPEFEIEDIG